MFYGNIAAKQKKVSGVREGAEFNCKSAAFGRVVNADTTRLPRYVLKIFVDSIVGTKIGDVMMRGMV